MFTADTYEELRWQFISIRRPLSLVTRRWWDKLTVQDSADEQRHFLQSIRASRISGVFESRSLMAAGLAMAKPARRVRMVMENFILAELVVWG